MMNGSIAKRYAIALFEEAKAQFVDQQVYEHLGVLHATLKAEPDLQMALINPRVTAEKKYTLLLLASGLDPKTPSPTLPLYEEGAHPDGSPHRGGDVRQDKEGLLPRFFHLLLKNHREDQLRMIIFVYRDLYREHHGIDHVVFETAVPVDDDVIDHLTERIKAHRHREVECVRKVNPRLIGGFRLRIGDRHYDYSYKHQLEKIRKELCPTP